MEAERAMPAPAGRRKTGRSPIRQRIFEAGDNLARREKDALRAFAAKLAAYGYSSPEALSYAVARQPIYLPLSQADFTALHILLALKYPDIARGRVGRAIKGGAGYLPSEQFLLMAENSARRDQVVARSLRGLAP